MLLPFCFLPQICHGCCMPVGLELGDPELFSCPRIERPEAAIICAGNGNQSSRGGNGTPEARHTSLWNSLRFQFIHNPERDLPNDFPGIQIDGIQIPPGWLLARVMVIIPKARVSSPLAGADICLRRAPRMRLHIPDSAHFADIDEEISK